MNRNRREEIAKYVDRLKELRPRIKEITWRRNSEELLAKLHNDIDYNYRNIKKYINKESDCISSIPNGLADVNSRYMTEHYKMLKDANEEISAFGNILVKLRFHNEIDEAIINNISDRFSQAITKLELAIEDPRRRMLRLSR